MDHRLLGHVVFEFDPNPEFPRPFRGHVVCELEIMIDPVPLVLILERFVREVYGLALEKQIWYPALSRIVALASPHARP